MHRYIHIYISLYKWITQYCTPETNTRLYINSTSIKNQSRYPLALVVKIVKRFTMTEKCCTNRLNFPFCTFDWFLSLMLQRPPRKIQIWGLLSLLALFLASPNTPILYGLQTRRGSQVHGWKRILPITYGLREPGHRSHSEVGSDTLILNGEATEPPLKAVYPRASPSPVFIK